MESPIAANAARLATSACNRLIGLFFTSRLAIAAAKFVSMRAALTAMAIFFLVGAGIGQMDAAYQKLIVKEGRYSLAPTGRQPWPVYGLHVGWTRKDAYIGPSDHAVLQSVALARFLASLCLYLTPVAWIAGLFRRRLASVLADGPATAGPGPQEAAAAQVEPFAASSSMAKA